MFHPAAPLLRVEDLHVALGGRTVLRGVGFDVRRGVWVGILGPNGSGKTTLLRALGAAVGFTGRIELEGRPLRSWPARALAQRLAFVRQATPLAFDFTVEDLVLLGRAPHKGWLESYGVHDRELLRRALAAVELAGFEPRSALSLSGGELQRVFLAQALVQEADLLLLDEPTAHLDIHHQLGFLEQVQRLVADGRTVLTVFHDLELAARFTDTLLVLQGGRLVAAGAPEDVLDEALIASVFRVRAECGVGTDGHLRVHYLGPLGSGSPAAAPAGN